MIDKKWVKVIGLTATLISVAATLLGNWSNEMTMNQTIDEKVALALAKMNEEES